MKASNEPMASRLRETVDGIQYPRENTAYWTDLGVYLKPAYNMGPRVVLQRKKFVIIEDKFPKSTIHYLILPRKDPTLLPQDAFWDSDFLEDCKQMLIEVKQLIARKLYKDYRELSKTEQARAAAKREGVPYDLLPPHRDWEEHIISGIHAQPSRKHIHIHVLSPDMLGKVMDGQERYRLFRTQFLIPLEKFPLPRKHSLVPQCPNGYWGRQDKPWHKDRTKCWFCHRDLTPDRDPVVISHLQKCFEKWKRI